MGVEKRISQKRRLNRPGVYTAAALLGLILAVGAWFADSHFYPQALEPHANPPKMFEKMYPGNIETLQVRGSLPGSRRSPVYKSSEDGGQLIINKVMGWITSSEAVSGPANFGKHGYPMIAEITTTDGQVLTVEPASDCVLKTNPDGSGSKTCSPVNGEIVVSGESEQIRLASSAMYEWLNGGWEKENTGLKGFTREDAILKVVEYCNQTLSGISFPTNMKPEEIVSRELMTGGPAPGTKLNVDLSVNLQFDPHQNVYNITLTQDYNVTVSGTKAISYWTYEVSPDEIKLIDKKEDGKLALLIR